MRPSRRLSPSKLRDRALVVALLGFILLLPPVATVFEIDANVAGVPVTVAYLFVVWALLIVGAASLARRLRDSAEGATEPFEPTQQADDSPPRRFDANSQSAEQR